jgi:hypothetical protein
MKVGMSLDYVLQQCNSVTQLKVFQCHFVHHKFHMDWSSIDTGTPWVRTECPRSTVYQFISHRAENRTFAVVKDQSVTAVTET